MSEPENFTAAQASDPQTPGQVLADIAALRPDLRPAVAANPSAYPGLLEWLGSLGDPAINAALAARRPGGAAAVAPQQAPTTPLPAQGYAPSGAVPATPYGQQAPSGYGQQVPPSGYGYQGTPPAKKSHKVLWIVLGVVGLLIVLGIVAVALIFNAARNAIAEYGSYGSDTSLDRLWDRCEGGDWQACDDLFWDAPIGSAYEDFGDTCGNRQPSSTNINCVDAFGGGTANVDPGGSSDAALDVLWSACEGGDWEACDDLYWQSPVGSAYEAFGDTCGNRSSSSASCVEEFGGGASSSASNGYGTDPALDVLWDACSGGDWQACDDLFWDAPVGSEYETYGDTCGGRQAEGTGDFCVDTMG